MERRVSCYGKPYYCHGMAGDWLLYMVMYMASMASVPESLYESAGLDGAGRMVQFFRLQFL